ncbi:glycoside hydrolase family 32 protein [Neobacillus cucumis]|uniref:glycoside hydrolase family 32 protein n=1 Tax=Neobacillus cucumis TaxID=1740721 RepID=UPI002E232A88|nr:glycoside hydrolase family 32 protein [Neobacillus cucumis]
MMKKRKFALLIYSLILAIVTVLLIDQHNKAIKMKIEHPKSKQYRLTTPAKGNGYRPLYHFSVPDKWKNDPQRPIFFGGKYHYYYLYNKDYPDGNGTEWRHATSEDLLRWTDEGIAIPKYTNKNGDPWSGSAVVDSENTAGFGRGAIIAIVTQPSANGGKQEQFLWYSKDNGMTFNSYSDTPIMANPGTKDFRDPKIIWDSRDHKWVMVLAEGGKIGFYESRNLISWHYLSSFLTEKIGTLECPDFYLMQANDGTFKWVLGASANGKAIDKPNTYAYWTGSFNGVEFFPDQFEPKWLDYGFDWYGGVTFEEEKKSNPLKKRYALAWMNKWDYANHTPTLKEGFNGMDSIVREIQLKFTGRNNYVLTSKPIEAINNLAKSKDYIKQLKVKGSKTLHITGDVYLLETDISWTDLKNAGIRLRESADKRRHVDVGIFVEQHYSYVNRAFTGQPDPSKQYLESKAPFDVSKKNVHLKILIDRSSIEVFVDEGMVVHSNLIFPKATDQAITLFSEGGTAVFKNIVVKHLKL